METRINRCCGHIHWTFTAAEERWPQLYCDPRITALHSATHHSPVTMLIWETTSVHHERPFTKLLKNKKKIKHAQTPAHTGNTHSDKTHVIKNKKKSNMKFFSTPAMQSDSHSKHTQEMQTSTWRGQHSTYRKAQWDVRAQWWCLHVCLC